MVDRDLSQRNRYRESEAEMSAHQHAVGSDRLRRLRQTLILLVGITIATAGNLSPAAATEGQSTFDNPDAAVTALLQGLKDHNVDAIAGIFGKEDWDTLVGPDKNQAREGFEQIYEKAQVAHKLVKNSDGTEILVIGAEAWPFPIPLVAEAGRWRFDTKAGVTEIINRRIGGNELSAIATLNEYVDAQARYASEDRDGDEVLEYAQRIVSTPGKQDGLYWPSQPGDKVSPFGPFVAESADYLEGRKAGSPFKGYYFKILTRQAASAPGGRYDYVINGNMIAGFAMIAYPAEYGNSGIMSFIVNQQGKVYQRDLGDDTANLAQAIDEYNPDGWTDAEE
jgi:hypothetical protein